MFARVGMHPIVPLLSVNLFVTDGSHKTDIDHVIFCVISKLWAVLSDYSMFWTTKIRDGFIVQSLITVIW